EGDDNIDNEEGDNHPGKRKPPAELGSGAPDTKIDPVRDDDAEVVGDEDEREARSAVVRARQLADPRRDDGVDEADAQAGHHAGAEEHVRVDAARHECRADDAKRRADEDAALAANPVTDPAYDAQPR